MIENLNVKINDIAYSKDNVCRKYIQTTIDGYRIETSYVNYENKYIICFSTQVGCSLRCKFCYNGIKCNFKRNLTDEEIFNQIENVIREESPKKDKPILFSAMGIGEPLLNYDNLIKAFCILDKKYPNNKFALATTGVKLQNILKLATDLKDINNFKLTISLHSADEEKRNWLMPISSDLISLVETVKQYKAISSREVEWNYVLFNNVNDSIEDARKLFELLGKDEIIKINKFNRVEISQLSESKNKDVFISTLESLGMQVEYYETNGADIDGACGQMVAD
ncbi:MAG: radical SAM protein [Clostridia bacterium]|nr:radical SAM protein [Clostridia bacterium]